MGDLIRIGTRRSALAMWQANWCAEQLRANGQDVELVELTTAGDVTTQPLTSVGGQGLFTKRIQEALLDNTVDVAVHSLKDLPTEPVERLVLAAVPKREDPRDVLISRGGESLDALPAKATIGTGSIRRQAQLRYARKDLQVADIRGNLDTRLTKLQDGPYDAIVLAFAGLQRMGWTDRISQVLEPDVMLPAVGQGALGLETRVDDEQTRRALAPLNDAESHTAVVAERSILRKLRAGCLAPVGCLATVQGEELQINAVVLDPAGSERILVSQSAPVASAEQLADSVAEELLSHGAQKLMSPSR